MILDFSKIDIISALFFMNRHKLQYMAHDGELKGSHFKNCDIYGFKDQKNRIKGLLILENRNTFWEPHIMFTKDVRGKIAIKSCKNWVKKHIKQYKLFKARTPLKFRGALQFSKWLGFKKLYEESGYLISELRYE